MGRRKSGTVKTGCLPTINDRFLISEIGPSSNLNDKAWGPFANLFLYRGPTL